MSAFGRLSGGRAGSSRCEAHGLRSVSGPGSISLNIQASAAISRVIRATTPLPDLVMRATQRIPMPGSAYCAIRLLSQNGATGWLLPLRHSFTRGYKRSMPRSASLRSSINKAEAHRDPWSVHLHEIDVSNPYLYSEDTWHGFFTRLRSEDPVHFVDSTLYGPYWSVTRYRDIMTVDTSHQIYSSEVVFSASTSPQLRSDTPCSTLTSSSSPSQGPLPIPSQRSCGAAHVRC